MNQSLAKKIPLTRPSKIQQQSFAMLNTLNQLYNYKPGEPVVKKRKKIDLPGAVDIYEMQINQKFKQAGNGQKRVKYWGELKDTVSESQKSKDSNLIRKQEWLQYLSNKSAYK